MHRVTCHCNIMFNCYSATSDTKWFEWIEEHFNVSSLEGRKITLEQFKETLQLEQVIQFDVNSHLYSLM